MKQEFDLAELEIIRLKAADIITTSSGDDDDDWSDHGGNDDADN